MGEAGHGMNPQTILVAGVRPGTGATTLAALLWSRIRSRAASLVLLRPEGLPDAFRAALELGTPERQPLEGRDQARITEACFGCGSCALLCRFGAIRRTSARPGAFAAHVTENAPTAWTIDPLSCTGCGVCARFCPSGAIVLRQPVIGSLEIIPGTSRNATAVAAALEPGREHDLKTALRLIREGRSLASAEPGSPVFVTGVSAAAPIFPDLCAASSRLVLVTAPGPGAARHLETALVRAHGRTETIRVAISFMEQDPEAATHIETVCQTRGIDFLRGLPYTESLHERLRDGRPLDALPAEDPVRTAADTILSFL
ncbi:MAG TPA: 4Fe-4S binding protein [Candidatus Ozemobacteraceae bacterium]|nr:4Fe-4S binding protein [Candidatus Ozemobacteraceae bacterium]